jgi:hypothetical protein
MTVEVSTPQGLRAGSSVYEVEALKSTPITSEEKPGSVALHGQATIVELPSGPLFALVETQIANLNVGNAATRVLRPDSQTGTVDDYVRAVAELGRNSGRAAELPRGEWPIMVSFHDIRDSKSVQRVDPEQIGVKRISVETTQAPVTVGIEKRLAWLRNEGESLDPSGGIDFSGNPPLAKSLRQSMFRTLPWD